MYNVTIRFVRKRSNYVSQYLYCQFFGLRLYKHVNLTNTNKQLTEMFPSKTHEGSY
jgi:predicted helicase